MVYIPNIHQMHFMVTLIPLNYNPTNHSDESSKNITLFNGF